jgi:serine/threonine protein kinase
MSTTALIRQGLSSLLNGAIIDIMAEVPGANKAIDLLRRKFTFTAAEIAENFQTSYGYAIAAISAGLVAPDKQPGFWRSLFQAKVEKEFAQGLVTDYLSPFAQQQGFSAAELADFRATAIEQCQAMAKLTLFHAENIPFSEAELAGFVTVGEVESMTQLILAQIEVQYQLNPALSAFFQYRELLGNALLFFLHEQLRREPRFENTLAALQREGLLIEVREIKQIVQATEEKFSETTQLSQRLERLQEIESITQTHYAQFIEFSQQFAQWAQFLQLKIEQVFEQIAALEEKIDDIDTNTREILAIVQQIMVQMGLSTQIKPRDELTRYSSDSLKLIKQAQQLLKRIPTTAPQYAQLAISLGSVVSSQGDLQQAEQLLTTAYQQANNDKERALSAFNLFQVFVRQQIYDQAFEYLQQAIQLDAARYALHNTHTYTIEQLLGAGGMGCVFLALHRLKKERVAIKCFWETLHGSSEELFKEAFLMAKIAGEYVPQPLDCGFVDPMRQQRGYFVCEYLENAIDGETWLAKYGKLDIATGIAVGLQIAQGLQLAHHQGIFHLDLKPANILLQRQADKITVKIIDFGLAKVAPSFIQDELPQSIPTGLSLLAQAAVFGTRDYAPPEQQGVTRYGKPGAKSDIYAFGKTLYRLLTGESPQTFLPRRLAEAPELFELLCDCVEIEPEKRVEVVDLIKQLQSWLSPIYQPPKSESIKPPPKPVEIQEQRKEQERIIQETEKRQAKPETAQPQKPVEKSIQPEQPQIVQIDKRQWWNQLDDEWKEVFKKAISVDSEPTDSELEKIVNLQELNCSFNKISDLEPLHALTNLQVLACHENQISDLQPLCALTNLQVLDCGSNEISDLQPLHALTNLQILDCGGNKISDLQPLHALTNLQVLGCNSNEISDLQPLHALTNLQVLSCWSNQISDLQPLHALTKLRELWCYDNQISDLQPLHALTNLQILDCGWNQISDLQPLHALTNLQELRCGENQISQAEIDKFKKAVPGCEIV